MGPTKKPVNKSSEQPTTHTKAKAAAPEAAAVVNTNPTSAPTSTKKPSSPLKIILIVVGVLVAMSVVGGIVTAYVGKRVVENGVGAITGGKAKVDTSNGSVTIKDKNGNETFSTSSKLPTGFPSDVPVYPSATVKVSTAVSEGSYSVTWATGDAADKVVSYYKTELTNQGWVMKEGTGIAIGSGYIGGYTKGDSELTLTISASGNNQTGIFVIVRPKSVESN